MSVSATTPRTPDLSGHALNGRYELHALIGEGAFGRVYRGRDRRLARPVAVKVIKPWWTEHADWVRRFEREAQLTASVSGPGIVQIFDVGQAEEGLYYVTELVEGESVATRLRRGPLAVGQACDVAEQLCRALAPAHARGVVHRDIKPANVLISAGGRVKVADFGVARLLGWNDTAPSTVIGTPAYMSPEQARGRGTSPATDVYSIGVVLYEMLAARPPFRGTSALDLALCHLQDPPPPLPAAIPPDLRAVVEHALAKDPAERYRNGGEMADALGRARNAYRNRPPAGGAARAAFPELRGPAGTLVAPWTSQRRNVRPARRRGTIAAFSAVLVVLVGMVAAAILMDRSGRAPVSVPRIVGFSSADARSSLQQLGLHTRLNEVPAPGVTTGTVTGQTPSPGAKLGRGSTVSLSVAEAPRWRAVTTFTNQVGQASAPFRIRGSRWRIVYRMSYNGACTFLFFCMGPTARVDNVEGGGTLSTFGLNSGSDQTRMFDSGPGIYQIKITPGDDSAAWSVEVEDYY